MITKIGWWLSAISAVPMALVFASSLIGDIAYHPLYLQLGCKIGLQHPCAALGYQIWQGNPYRGIHQDLPGAKDLLERACDKNNARACGLLAEIYSAYPQNVPFPEQGAWVNGVFRFTENRDEYQAAMARNTDYTKQIKDDAKADQLMHKACAAGDALSCWHLNLTSRVPVESDNAPWLAILWLAMFLATLGMAVVVCVRRPGPPHPERRMRRWLFVPAAFALFYFAVGIGELATADHLVDIKTSNVIGYTLFLLGLLIIAGTLMVVRKQDRIAKWLMAVAGFFALPVGLMLVLISREIAALHPKAPAQTGLGLS